VSVIGLTGGFGTGKTTVAKMFVRLGARTVDVDSIAHALTRPQKPLWKRYLKLFGKNILQKNKELNRKKIAQIVFSNRTRLKQLVLISHPLILATMQKQIRILQKKSGKPIVVDLPLLFEDHLEKQFETIIVVFASQKKVMVRVQKTRPMTRAEIRKRIQSQKPLSQKRKKADFVINNNNGLQRTFSKVKTVYTQLP